MTLDFYRQVFDTFDTDNSGYISATEIQSILRTFGRDIKPKQVHQLLAESGITTKTIDYDQFVKLMGTHESKCLTLDDVEQIFQAVDLDCSGYLTTAELRHVMTNLKLSKDDAIVDQMISSFDTDGDNQITIIEFVHILEQMGFQLEDGVLEVLTQPTEKEVETHVNGNVKDDGDVKIKISGFPEQVQSIMSLFDHNSTNQVSLRDLRRAAELLNLEKMTSSHNPEANPALHWKEGREKRGLGDLIYKANHIALIVSDVGRSAAFYSDIMGFQQIRRPNFDKHGAWFTMGNLELHLIKGNPVVHDGDDLVVGHISIETFEIDKVPSILRKLKVPFRQNVSVPKGKDAGTKGTNSSISGQVMTQYFIRDPDGYYIEICNCDMLTSYCLDDKCKLAGYHEGVKPLSVSNAAKIITLMHNWTGLGDRGKIERENLIAAAKATDGSVEALAKLLGAVSEEKVDEVKLQNLKTRRSVYGDICQNETEDQLKRLLKACGNDVKIVNDLMKLRVDVEGRRIVIPPAFYEEGKQFVKPPANMMEEDL